MLLSHPTPDNRNNQYLQNGQNITPFHWQPPKSGQSSGKPRKKNEKDRLKKEEAEAAAQAGQSK